MRWGGIAGSGGGMVRDEFTGTKEADMNGSGHAARAAVLLTALAGSAAAVRAQESVSYRLSFVETQVGPPITNPNNRIDPGESARVMLTVTMTPGIGSSATYAPPPPPGVGTIAGLGSVFFDLNQTNAGGGFWGPFGRATGFAFGSGGFGNPDGSLSAAQAGQFVLPGSTANSTNPVNNIWRGTWSPSDYTPRTVRFTAVPAAAAGGNHTSILIQYGVDGAGNPLYIPEYVPATFGYVDVPIVPEPGGAVMVAMGMAYALRRRRRP